jgi:chromosome segregation ATPase
VSERQKAGSFQDILEQNQQFIGHLQALQEAADAQLTAKQDELVQTRSRLEQAAKELTGLRHDKLESAASRQALTEELELLKKQHSELKVAYDNLKAEFNRLEVGVERAAARDTERRVELQRLETQRLDLSRRLDVEQEQYMERMTRIRHTLDGLQGDIDSYLQQGRVKAA